MVGVVEGFRWALLGYGHRSRIHDYRFRSDSAHAVGRWAFYFRRMERTFADVV